MFDIERNPDGSIKYTGFAIDILDRISEKLNFSYEIVKNAAGYGSCTESGKCDGMVKELVEHVSKALYKVMPLFFSQIQVATYYKQA